MAHTHTLLSIAKAFQGTIQRCMTEFSAGFWWVRIWIFVICKDEATAVGCPFASSKQSLWLKQPDPGICICCVIAVRNISLGMIRVNRIQQSPPVFVILVSCCDGKNLPVLYQRGNGIFLRPRDHYTPIQPTTLPNKKVTAMLPRAF